MADAPSETETTETTTETETEEGATSPEDEVKKWKALARQNEKQAKANAAAAEELAKLKDADRSESEKAAAKAADAERRAEEAELRALRLEIAGEKGLTPSQAKRLVGTTREELEADADELLEDFVGKDKPKVPPRPKPAGGSKDKTGQGELEGKERAAAALRDMRNTR